MSQEAWTPLKLIGWTHEYFRKKGIDQPRLEAELLLAHVMGWKRIDLYTRFEEAVGAEKLVRFRELVKKRGEHVPTQYLMGSCEFYGLEFAVDGRVLIPRPETEHLVSETVGAVKELERPAVVELCTGSGAAAVAVAKNAGTAHVYASDISAGALEVARVNVERHGVAERVELFQGDLFAAIPKELRGKADVVAANPPYVSEAEFAGLMPEVALHEPRQALVAGKTGLEAIERILKDAGEWLNGQGSLILEVGSGQAELAAKLAEVCGTYGPARRVRDYSKVERVMVWKRREAGRG